MPRPAHAHDRLRAGPVPDSIEEYVVTALPEPGSGTAVTIHVLEHRTQLVEAMKQESARGDLGRVVVTIQQTAGAATHWSVPGAPGPRRSHE